MSTMSLIEVDYGITIQGRDSCVDIEI